MVIMDERFMVLMFNAGEYDFNVRYFVTLLDAEKCWKENKDKYDVCLNERELEMLVGIIFISLLLVWVIFDNGKNREGGNNVRNRGKIYK
jgi:hypothetical protein